jgi:membrane-associated phospholipid phosphatase
VPRHPGTVAVASRLSRIGRGGVLHSIEVLRERAERPVARRWRTQGPVLVAGLALLALSWGAAVDGTVSSLERSAFDAVNAASDAIRWPIWVVMQMGALPGAALIAVAAALAFRAWQPPTAVALASLWAWTIAGRLKVVVERGRPAAVLDDVVIRGHAASGFGYPSGHAAVAFAVATALAPFLPRWGKVTVFVLAATVGIARLYVGAHLPLDIIGGAGVGLAAGATVNLLFGTPAPGGAR